MRSRRFAVSVALFGAMAMPVGAAAQDGDFAALMAMGDGELEDALEARYEAGLARSLDPAIVAADDARYYWALESKVQCGIAIGFMKSSTRDETSIRKCQLANDQMDYVSTPPVVAQPQVAQPPVRRNEQCDDAIAGMVFFEFDSAAVTGDAGQTLATVVNNARDCNWSRLTVVGHTDQAGTDAYNMRLSQERAAAVANALRSRGGNLVITTDAQGESNPRVPLADGTRSPQNRRVEISAE